MTPGSLAECQPVEHAPPLPPLQPTDAGRMVAICHGDQTASDKGSAKTEAAMCLLVQSDGAVYSIFYHNTNLAN